VVGGVRMSEVLACVADVTRRGDAERFRSDAHGQSLARDAPKLALVHVEARTPEPLALGPSPPEPRSHTLRDQAPLQLCNGRDDREDRLPKRRAGVDLLAKADEFHVEVPEHVERLDQLPHGAPEPIEGRDDHHVHLAGLHGGHEAIERGAPIFGPGDPLVDVLLGLPTARADVRARVL
jgi:hypothetical protein